MSSIAKSSKSLYAKLKVLSKASEIIQSKLQLAKAKTLMGKFSPNKDGCEKPKNKPKDDALRRFVMEKMGHFKYGLYTEDLITEDLYAVKEAIKRLPPDVYDARAYRIIRAIFLDSQHKYLPKDQWITYEEDNEYSYLLPIIKQVERELQEQREHGIYIPIVVYN